MSKLFNVGENKLSLKKFESKELEIDRTIQTVQDEGNKKVEREINFL